MKVGDYLYFYSGFRGSINRVKIERETKTQWVLETGNRVRKENLNSLGSYSNTYYKQETEELVIEYLNQCVMRKIFSKLDSIYEKRNHYIRTDLSIQKVEALKIKVEALENEFKELLPKKEV